MAVTIMRKNANGEFVKVKVVEKSPVDLSNVANRLVLDPTVAFKGNTEFVTIDPNRFFKRKR